MHSVAVYDVGLRWGGGEEGGWWFQAGERETAAELMAMGKIVNTEAEAVKAQEEIQKILDEEWNTGDRKYDLSCSISGGKYLALIHEGWPPTHFPEVRPHYE